MLTKNLIPNVRKQLDKEACGHLTGQQAGVSRVSVLGKTRQSGMFRSKEAELSCPAGQCAGRDGSRDQAL